MSSSQPYALLVGVGTFYVGPANEPKPELDADPAGNWRDMGLTDGGLTATKTQNIEKFSADQRTGNLKAVRTEEGMKYETNLQEATLENLADVINGTVTLTAAGAGQIGEKSMTLYKGATVEEFAVLYRGDSAYGDFPAQLYCPRGFFDEDVGMEFTKDGKTLIPVMFDALEDLNAATPEDRFGQFDEQTADATS